MKWSELISILCDSPTGWRTSALSFTFLHVCLLICAWPFETPLPITCYFPLSMGFSRQECWSGLHSLFQGIFSTQRSNPCLLHWQANSLLLCHLGSPLLLPEACSIIVHLAFISFLWPLFISPWWWRFSVTGFQHLSFKFQLKSQFFCLLKLCPNCVYECKHQKAGPDPRGGNWIPSLRKELYCMRAGRMEDIVAVIFEKHTLL